MGNKKDIALVYMVAGLSSRFGGKIKQFAKVGKNGESLIEVSIRQALPAGFSKIVFVVGEKTEKPFKERFGDNFLGVPVSYAFQSYDPSKRDRPWGTTDALYAARGVVDTPFVMCNGDDLYGEIAFKQLVENLENNSDSSATVGYLLECMLSNEGTVTRGIFEVEDGYVKNIKETFNVERKSLDTLNLKLTDFGNGNIFAFQPTIFELFEPILKSFKQEHADDRKAECLLPVEISRLIKDGGLKMRFYSGSGGWTGVTNPGDEEKVRSMLADREKPRVTVGVMIFNKDKKVLLVKSDKWGGKYIFPGGHVEFGEKISAAAIREIKEETGLDIYDLEFFRILEFINPPDYFKANLHFVGHQFIAKTDGSEVVLNEEGTEYKWIKVEEALKEKVIPEVRFMLSEYFSRNNKA